MVLMKPEDKKRYDAMRRLCGQERDLTVKQVEHGYIVQAITRFFTDEGCGPVQMGEVIDTCVAVSAHECALVTANFIRHGEFWPDDMVDDDEYKVVGLKDPVLDAIMPEQREQWKREINPETGEPYAEENADSTHAQEQTEGENPTGPFYKPRDLGKPAA